MKELYKLANKEETSINKDLFQKHFSLDKPSALLRSLSHTKDKTKNKELVNLIKSGLSDLIDEIKNEKNETENETGIKEPDKMVDIVKRILEFNRQTQEGQGLKILTPQQMLIAQLKAGNNSQKLKNEIRQLLYSLYRSKKLSKTICNNLSNAF